MKKYGHIIAKLRKSQGLTQEQLGAKLNVSYQAVSKWEHDLSEPDLETIKKLSNIFNISIADFFDMIDNPELLDNPKTIKKETKENNNFIKTKALYLVAGLGMLIIILSLCVFLIPVKHSNKKMSGKQIFDKYENSIFYISSENSSSTKSGTGFFIDKTGLAVTIYSNIEDCTNGTIKLNNGKEHIIEKIVGIDKENNIAILQIDIDKSKPIKLGNSNNISMGDKVYSITYTTECNLDEAKSILSEGMIYKVESDNKGVVSFQTTATTEKSNKGGVVFNEYGDFIGFVSRKLDISGLDFDMVNVAIPSNFIKNVKNNINISMEEYVNNLYTLNFYNSNNELIETKEVNKGFVLNSYNKTGYVICGLYTDKEFQNPYNIKTEITVSQDIYVDMRPIKYTIIFNSNGADGTMEPQIFYYDEPQTLTKCTFYIENKMLSYWSADERKYYDEQQIMNITSKDNDIINLSAVWEDLKFTIEFDSNGGNGNMSPTSYLYNETLTLPSTRFHKQGYKFSHWECNENTYQDEDVVGFLSKTQTKFIFKAIWTPITYQVKYCASDYSCDWGILAYDQTLILPNCYYQNQEVDYLTYKNQKYYVGDAVSNLATYNTTVTFNIVWKGVDFKIRYYADDTNYVEYQYTWGNVTLPSSATFKKEGYWCSGFTAPKYDDQYFGTLYTFSSSETKYVIYPNETLIFKVKWNPISYDVIIDNLSINNNIIECEYDKEYIVPENMDYLDGYTFVNYSIRINGETVGTIGVGETFINLTSNSSATIYFKPNWEAIDITLNFYAEGQLWKSDTVKYDSFYTIPYYSEEKDGMWFNGWMLEDEYNYPGKYSQVKYLNSENNFNIIWSKQLKGEGSEQSPYLIETYEDLCSIRYIFGTYNFKNKIVKLVNDIDCENKLLNTIEYFDGCVFDGNNKVIKNAQFEKALFGCASNSIIKNLGVENYNINYVGDKHKSFAGFIIACYNSTIENCWSEGKINVVSYRKNEDEIITIGGFCSWANTNPIIKNCYSKTEISFTRSNPNGIVSKFTTIDIGGFIGAFMGTIENCYSITSFDTTEKHSSFISYKAEETIINCFYGVCETELNLLDNPELLSELYYHIMKDNESVTSEILENLYDLEYLNQTLNFDITIWKDEIDSFPTLKSFEVKNKNSN